jgi:signal peptidase I
LKPKNKRFETIQAVLIAILAALVLRQFVIAAYKIPSSSMEDTLLVGDFLLVNKFVYGAKSPEWIGIPFTQDKKWIIPTGFNVPPGLQFRFPEITPPHPYDVVVFSSPQTPQLDFIKRCIAVGRQEVEVKNKIVYVNDQVFPKPPGSKNIDSGVMESRDFFGPLTVPEGHYFMMGDNRDNSSDSREWGTVPAQNIIGKPLIIYLSLVEDPYYPGGMWDKIRWNRLGTVVR